MPLIAKSRQYVFSSGFTRELATFTLVNLIFSLWVFWNGWSINQRWLGKHRGDYFLVAGAVLLLALAVILMLQFGRTIQVTKSNFIYRAFNRPEVRIPWSQMVTFIAPRAKPKWLRRAVVGDGVHVIDIESKSFHQFDDIVEIIVSVRSLHGLN